MLTAVRRALADHLKPYLGLDPTAQSNPSHMQALAESTQITHTAALDSLGPPARRIRARDGAPVLCSPPSSPSGAAPPTSTLEEEAQLQLALARSEAEAAAPPPPPPTATPTTTPAAIAIRSSRHSCDRALQSQGRVYGAPHEKKVLSPSRDRALHNQGSFCGAPHDEKGIFRPGATYMTIRQPCVYRHAQHTSRRRVTMQIRRAFEHIARARASAVRAHRRHSRSRPGLVIRQPEVWIRTSRVSSENGSLDLPG